VRKREISTCYFDGPYLRRLHRLSLSGCIKKVNERMLIVRGRCWTSPARSIAESRSVVRSSERFPYRLRCIYGATVLCVELVIDDSWSWISLSDLASSAASMAELRTMLAAVKELARAPLQHSGLTGG